MGTKHPDRRDFLKRGAALAGGLTLGGAQPGIGQTPASDQDVQDQNWSSPELIAYGQRSNFETSVRIPHGGRPSPDAFGLVFHNATPIQDQMGVITPSALHFSNTTRGAIIPNIDPREHQLMIHGLVDRPLIFTMDDLKRLPSVTRLHFVECAGNRARSDQTTVQETHGAISCAEWTGVLLSTLLNEAGVKPAGTWIVAEGVESVKGASSIPIAKAMDDCLVCYGMNGEPVRPQQGHPLRLLAPGFEGILNVKWLRRFKVVDRFYMTYNDYGHLKRDPDAAALSYQVGPKSVITYPSGGQQLPDRGFYEVRGLAWSGGGAVRRVEVSTDGGRRWMDAEIRGTAHRMAQTAFSFHWNWDGTEAELMSRCTDELGQVQPTRAQAAEFGRSGAVYPGTPDQPLRVTGLDNSIQPWRIASDGGVHNAIT